MHTADTVHWVSPPTDSPQFLLREYRTPHGIVRTIATRQHQGDTWGPEHDVHPEPVGREVI